MSAWIAASDPGAMGFVLGMMFGIALVGVVSMIGK